MNVLESWLCFFFFQAEDGIRDLVRSRGLGDVYKRQGQSSSLKALVLSQSPSSAHDEVFNCTIMNDSYMGCLLYTSDAADERSSVDLGGRRIIKKKNHLDRDCHRTVTTKHITKSNADIYKARATILN